MRRNVLVLLLRGGGNNFCHSGINELVIFVSVGAVVSLVIGEGFKSTNPFDEAAIKIFDAKLQTSSNEIARQVWGDINRR